jgi:hypothetical protein
MLNLISLIALPLLVLSLMTLVLRGSLISLIPVVIACQ